MRFKILFMIFCLFIGSVFFIELRHSSDYDDLHSYKKCILNSFSVLNRIKEYEYIHKENFSDKYLNSKVLKKLDIGYYDKMTCSDFGIYIYDPKLKQIRCSFHGSLSDERSNYQENDEFYANSDYYYFFKMFLIVFIGLIAYSFGEYITRRKEKYIFYILGILFILGIVILRNYPEFLYNLGYTSLLSSNNDNFIVSVCISFIFPILLFELKDHEKRLKILIKILFIISYIYYGLFQTIETLNTKHFFAYRENLYSRLNVCIQRGLYSCGAAAGVNVLKLYGIDAYESQIAIIAETNSIVGTTADMLCKSINKLYKNKIFCEEKYIKNLEELRKNRNFIALVKKNVIEGHYLVVLRVLKYSVWVCDSAGGSIYRLKRSEFEDIWINRIILFKSLKNR